MTGSASSIAPDWLAGLFEAIDSQNSAGFLEYLNADAEFRFGSSPSVFGREAVGAAVDGFFSTISGLTHRPERFWIDTETIVCEGEVTYRRHDNSEICLPFTNVFDLANDKIARYRIYIDISPLYAQ
jgi:limonene-1,2-epoxide hydrolase